MLGCPLHTLLSRAVARRQSPRCAAPSERRAGSNDFLEREPVAEIIVPAVLDGDEQAADLARKLAVPTSLALVIEAWVHRECVRGGLTPPPSPLGII
jgi:hypothetical protein